jgi:L-lactate dehydrogenase (cytochrome)
MMATVEQRFACVADMEKAAKRKIPRFAHDYLIGGLGEETCVFRNRADLSAVELMPRYLHDGATPDLSVTILDQTFDAPFGVAPVGSMGLQWPGSELPVAAAARAHNILHVLSSYSNASMEVIKPVVGPNGWFQFYPPNDPAIEDDMLARVRAAGYQVLVVTVDIPGPTRRERDIRNGFTYPVRFGPRLIAQAALKPHWCLEVLRHGGLQFGNLQPYYPKGASIAETAHYLLKLMEGHITPARFSRIRQAWRGPVVVKGVLDPREAEAYLRLGADGIIVSNHGGRQLDAAPSTASVLPAMRRTLGPDVLIMVDGGVRSGLDVARMLALGANFVFAGRPFVFASAALGSRGADYLITLLKDELTTTLIQLGCNSVGDLPSFLHRKQD